MFRINSPYTFSFIPGLYESMENNSNWSIPANNILALL